MSNGYDTQTNVAAETAIKHYVNQNILNPSNTNRNISNLVIKADQLRGNDVSTKGRFQTVAELIKEICLDGDVGFEVTFNETSKNNEFDVIQGVDRTSGTDNPVTFSPSSGNIKTIDFEESLLTKRNLAYVAGQGQGENRIVRAVFNDAVEPSGYDRKETYVDARDLDNSTELDTRGQAKLADNKEQLLMSFDYLDRGLFSYLDDFDLGDDVTVDYPDVATLETTIIKITESYTPSDGKTVQIGIGRERPDIYKVIKDDIRNLQPEQRK